MRFEDVAKAVEGVPFMSPAHGRRVYDHVRDARPEHILELGSGYGVGAAYMAAALDENGSGRLTTVDYSIAGFTPRPETLLAEVGLAEWVEVVRDFSTYTWFLKERIEERSDLNGNCEPVYDFVYLDGSKNWTVDGLAVFLVEKLLKTDGWLLMDDLHWRYADSEWGHLYDGNGRPLGPLSARERDQPHLRAVFDLIVMQHPDFTTFRIEDDGFGWACKRPGAPRHFELASSRPLTEVIATTLRRAVRRRRGVRPHSSTT
jgi:predicted O-methyltransferase YrrM